MFLRAFASVLQVWHSRPLRYRGDGGTAPRGLSFWITVIVGGVDVCGLSGRPRVVNLAPFLGFDEVMRWFDREVSHGF